MSERFGIPDHSPQHAPDHSLQNPTSLGSWGSSSGGSDWSSGQNSAPTGSWGSGSTASAWSGAATNVGSGALTAGSPPDRTKKIKTAIVLAMIFGPLGLFYVGILHGVAALFIVMPVVRAIALNAASAFGGHVDPLVFAIPLIWSITVPWAIIVSRLKNRKLKRSQRVE